MLVRYYCGCYVGLYRWHDTERCEPDECIASGIIECDEEDWNNGDVEFPCPECGILLTQYMDHFTKVNNE